MEDTQSHIRVGRSRNGSGIFAKKNIPKGELIFVVSGRFISGDIDEDIDERTRDNALRFDKRKYISPGGTIADFLNHSCVPNAYVSKEAQKLCIRALRDIVRNEEVAIDYSTITADDDIWEMACNCGEVSCRKVVRQFRLLPKKLREQYIKMKIVPKYIFS